MFVASRARAHGRRLRAPRRAVTRKRWTARGRFDQTRGAVPPAPDDRDDADAWRSYALQLQGMVLQLTTSVAELNAKLDALARKLYRPKSEKVPPVARELAKESTIDPAETRRKRAERAELKDKLVAETIEHKVSPDARDCPRCTAGTMEPAGDKPSVVYEYVPGYFRKQIHRRETLRCSCGDYIVTAESPARVTDKTQYGPGFVAHLVTAKCGDSIPLYRLEKSYKRLGISIARSTMTDLFHRAGEVLEPLWKRLLSEVAKDEIVLADETPIKLQRVKKRAYIWTFLAGNRVVYVFSPNRSGKVAKAVLGDSKGKLLVDAYTGYNAVTTPAGRERAGCLAHARRKFVDALPTAPGAARALELILEVYRVEHHAREEGIVRTVEHLNLRQTRSLEAMDRLERWLKAEKPKHPPKSPIGRAIAYSQNQWTALTRFLDDVRLPVDNNRSEAALRVIALGRKNFLFLGHEQAGRNAVVLYTLIACCDAAGVNPLAYLTDVLLRVQTHPASRIDELLPAAWGNAHASAKA